MGARSRLTLLTPCLSGEECMRANIIGHRRSSIISMINIQLSLSCCDYDRTRPLIDGIISTPGLDLTVIALPSGERHKRFVRNLEFDVCELQIAQYLGLKSRGAPITAVPVFPHRRFNHSCVMVRMDSNIARPEDLRGRRVGVHGHFNPIALWIRGLLQHEYALPPS